jgi:hypothetical protein
VNIALTAVLAVMITLATGDVVRSAEARTGGGTAPLSGGSLTAWFHAVGALTIVAVLVAPTEPGIVLDVSTRIGGLLLVEGAVVLGVVAPLVWRRHLLVTTDPAARPTPEDPR